MRKDVNQGDNFEPARAVEHFDRHLKDFALGDRSCEVGAFAIPLNSCPRELPVCRQAFEKMAAPTADIQNGRGRPSF